MKLSFIFEKETKGAVRYQEVTDSGEVAAVAEYKIGTIYIRKSAFASGQHPKAFTLTLEVDNG